MFVPRAPPSAHMSGGFYGMIVTSSPAADCGGPASDDGFADRLLLWAAGSPGLIDAAAVQAGVACRIEWLGRLFPILGRLLARAAAGDADGFAGFAWPLVTPFAFGLGEQLTPPPSVPVALHFGDLPPPLANPSASDFGDPPNSPRLVQRAGETPFPSPSTDSPPQLVRVRRGGFPDAALNGFGTAPTGSGAAPTRPGLAAAGPGANATGTGDGVGTFAGQTSPSATTREISAVTTTPATLLHVDQAPGTGQGVRAPVIAGTGPAPRGGTQPSPAAGQDQGSPAMPYIGSWEGRPGPAAAPSDAVRRVRELSVPRTGAGVETVVEPGAALLPGTGANEVQAARTNTVPEPFAPRSRHLLEMAGQPFPSGAALPPPPGEHEVLAAPARTRSGVARAHPSASADGAPGILR